MAVCVRYRYARFDIALSSMTEEDVCRVRPSSDFREFYWKKPAFLWAENISLVDSVILIQKKVQELPTPK